MYEKYNDAEVTDDDEDKGKYNNTEWFLQWHFTLASYSSKQQTDHIHTKWVKGISF